jgi:carbonic anhydrase
MKAPEKLLLANKAWVQEKLTLKADFFEIMADGQQPEFLWIGCSDSRVPAEEITGTAPGELFVHRNIANLVVHTDFNLLSVVQYAVEVLKVKHVIVCGHYGCGGIKAAMGRKHWGLLNKWLRNIKDVYRLHRGELDMIANEDKRYDRLVELNVLEQVRHLAEMSFVQKAWFYDNMPTLHGWVYCMRTGILKEVIDLAPGQFVDDIYRYDFEPLPDPKLVEND